MSKRTDSQFLMDIREACLRIHSYVEGVDYEKFIKDKIIQDAVIRNFEILGEAAKNISADIKKRYPTAIWKELAGFRDKLIHDYFGVNYDIVWNIASQEISGVLSLINDILKKESNE